MDGNIMVDGILASCYASVDHDLAHIGTIPLRWFLQIIELVCGVDDGDLGYIIIMKHLDTFCLHMNWDTVKALMKKISKKQGKHRSSCIMDPKNGNQKN